MWMRRVIFVFIFSERAARRRGGARCQTFFFFFFFFPCSADHERDWPPCIRVNLVGEEDGDHVYTPTAYTADDGANRSSRANLQAGTTLHLLPRGRRDRNPGYVR